MTDVTKASTPSADAATGDTMNGQSVGFEAAPLHLKICFGWGLGYLGLIALLQAVSTLMLKYITDILGVAAAVAGIIIAATRIFDAIIDPLMGTISDRTHSRWGRRRPYLLLGAFLCAGVPLMMFVVPQWVPSPFLVAYIAVSLVLYAIAFTVFNVPHLAMPVEMTQSPSERTYLFTFRMYGFAFGNLLGGSLAPWIVGQYDGQSGGYEAMGYTMSVIVLLACLGSFYWTAKAPVAPVDVSKKLAGFAQFKGALQNKPLRALLLIKVALVTGAAVSGGGLAFFVTTVMERSLSIFPIFGLALTIGIVICQPVWLRIAARIGKKHCYIAASAFYGLAMASWLLSGPNETLFVLALRGFFLGLSAGGALLVSQSMLPDVLHYEVHRTKIRNEGVLTGLFSTAERGSAAVGIAIAGVILSVGGYVSGTVNGPQPESAITAIYVVVSVGPLIGILLSMVAALFYNLPEVEPSVKASPA